MFAFIMPLPPPLTGQSVACELLYESFPEKEDIALINISKFSFSQGINSLGRLWSVLNIFWKCFIIRRRSDLIYLTISESIAGNLKDIIIYLIFWNRIDRMVIHLHGGAGMRKILSKKSPLLFTINSFFLKRMGGVIVLGDRLKSMYVNVVSPSKLHVVPNFANEEYFVSPELIDLKFECVDEMRLLFLSNLLPGKGHVELLAALSQLPIQMRRRLHVDFVGGFESSDAESHFLQMVQAVSDLRIRVHGVVHGEKKRQFLERAHLFCLPTYYPYEGQPISILEAYASGCAVMTTDHSGIFDTFTPGVNGFEVEPRNPASIRAALEQALEHPDQLFRFARANHNKAINEYRTVKHLETLKKIIFSVAN